MVSRFIVRDNDIDYFSKGTSRLNKGQAMLRGCNAAIRDTKRLRERREKISLKN